MIRCSGTFLPRATVALAAAPGIYVGTVWCPLQVRASWQSPMIRASVARCDTLKAPRWRQITALYLSCSPITTLLMHLILIVHLDARRWLFLVEQDAEVDWSFWTI